MVFKFEAVVIKIKGEDVVAIGVGDKNFIASADILGVAIGIGFVNDAIDGAANGAGEHGDDIIDAWGGVGWGGGFGADVKHIYRYIHLIGFAVVVGNLHG